MDDSIYTGTAADIDKRMKVHFEGGSGESKYVRAHGAKKLEVFWQVESKGQALSLERRIKGLSRKTKEELILKGGELIPEL